MNQNLIDFHQAVAHILPAERIFQDELHRLTYGTDASFYRLIPELVLKVNNESEIIALLQMSQKHSVPVTFRAAGTSLSGQAVTDSVLIVLEGNSWRDFSIQNDGAQISLQPGLIGAQVNKYLAPLGRKIGPDPASIDTCKIGGIAANNASGMCCGTAQNSYHTMSGMRVIFSDGGVLDSRSEEGRLAFIREHDDLYQGILHLALHVQANEELCNKIRHKFRLKNTTGYSLNALVDFTDPIDIITHLMIGSEGTLGFISAIDYNTVPEHPHKATTLVLLPTIEAACQAVAALKSQPVDAVELIDRAGLRSVQDKPGMPEYLSTLADDVAALLIDVRAATPAELEHKINQVNSTLSSHALVMPFEFTQDKAEYSRLWNIRKGMFPAVGAVRPVGTTVLIEDVAFPIESLAQGTRELQELFKKYAYHEAIIFGHALEGNLHFVFTQDFGTQTEVDRYAGFMSDVADLVAVKYGGSLKAEHGTGRNMAPFVELEWGTDAYQLMWAIKRLLDPANLLNPGVVLNEDPNVHLHNLKPMPAADPLIDRCIECGFCEPICPSRNLSLTPRQRIVAAREQARLQAAGDEAGAALFASTADYDFDQTCAIDGLCSTRCPVGINTGALVHARRQDRASERGKKIADQLSSHMAWTTRAARTGLGLANGAALIFGSNTLTRLSTSARKVSKDIIPVWHPYMPRKAVKVSSTSSAIHANKVVYFPSCVSRTMGAAHNDSEHPDLHQVMRNLLEKAQFETIIPPSVDDLCCGMAFASKGYTETANTSVQKLEATLWAASEQGKYPILCDTSPCTLRMIEQFTLPLKVYESTAFIAEFLLPHLNIVQKEASIALHVSCSTRKLGLEGAIRTIAKTCAEQVIEPEEDGCCGFAGDKGFSKPELNAASLRRLKQQLPSNCNEGFSNSRTCEIGLSLHSDRQYRSIVYLVDRCSTAK